MRQPPIDWIITQKSDTEPISVEEVKAQLYLCDDDGGDDALIARCITAARQHVEHLTGMALVQQTREGQASTWASRNYVELPGYPLQSVSAIGYTDTSGNEYVWDSANYFVDTIATPGRVWAASWPKTALIAWRPAVKYTYVCGYADAASVPEDVRAAMFLLIGDLYENREAVVVEAGLTPVTLATARNLYQQYRRVIA